MENRPDSLWLLEADRLNISPLIGVLELSGKVLNSAVAVPDGRAVGLGVALKRAYMEVLTESPSNSVRFLLVANVLFLPCSNSNP